MSILEILHPNKLQESRHDELTIDEIRKSLGEVAMARLLINNREGAPTEFDPITGKKKSFARLNFELTLRNKLIGLTPSPNDELPVDRITDISTFEEIYPEDVSGLSKK